MTSSVEVMEAPGEALPTHVRVGYSLGSLTTGAFGTVPGLLLLPYLTDTLGVAAGLAGLLVLLPKAWDVVLNPLVGRISDRTQTRWGARRPYLLFAGLGMAALFAGIFAAPLGISAYSGLYVVVMFLLTATAFGFFQVPYVAMPAEMTSSPDERTRLMTWRVALLATSILVSGALAPIIRDSTGGGVPGYRWMGLFVAAIMVAGTCFAFFSTAKAPTGVITASEPSLRVQLKVVAANRPFRVLVACFVVQATGVACMLGGVEYFARHVLGDPGTTTTLFVVVVSPALVVMPFWRRVGERLGKLKGYVVASITLTVATLVLVAAPVLPNWAVYAIIAVIGFGYAGQQLFGLAMLPDCIAYDTARTGKRQAGVFTGVWTAGETLGLALGPFIFGIVLQAFGYISTTAGMTVTQTDSARTGVLLGFTVVPGLIVGIALVLLRGYDLGDMPAATQSAPAKTKVRTVAGRSTSPGTTTPYDAD
ncbi:MFS transporter [Catellatospora sp. KI3]|uniref:MFS transporter n=1 Tax=Catellatospora sp. KI3 TaxID=3041620 RepID=UPI00248296A3|nr:MFS transporter [Catellatospora sp. KI3]MDI1460195.1 MFS transporter [Catellatospora sp. KI3]